MSLQKLYTDWNEDLLLRSLSMFIVKNVRKMANLTGLLHSNSGNFFSKYKQKNASRVSRAQNILTFSFWHFHYTVDYKYSQWSYKQILISASIEFLETHYRHSSQILIETDTEITSRKCWAIVNNLKTYSKISSHLVH